VRSRLQVDPDADDQTLLALAMADANTLKYLEGKVPKKTIVVKKKLVNIVV
jgi:leucyl-tRNA synthetase